LGLPAALYAALAVGTLRGVHKTGTSPHDVPCDFEPAADDSRHAPAVHGHPVCGFQPANHELQISSAACPGHFHLSASGCCNLKLCGSPGLIRRGELRELTLRLLAGDAVLFCAMASRMHLIEGRTFGSNGCRDLRRPAVRPRPPSS